MSFRILVIGGYGLFGGRICRALASEPDAWIGVAGRDGERAKSFVESIPANAATCEPLALDHDAAGFGERLREIRPQLIVHTAGPFQAQSYRVAHAAIAAGAHYVDLADGREFVNGIGRLDVDARARALIVTSGASTLPAVSTAVIDHLAEGLAGLDRVEISIAPAQSIPRGKATLAGVLSYCGKPFRERFDGAWRTVYGWQGLRRIRYPDMAARWAARCDVPDLDLLPERYQKLRSVRFDAALELAVAQWGMWMLAALVRVGVIRHPERLAGFLLRMARHLDSFGTDVGGMHVAIEATKSDGSRIRRAWYLVAKQGGGPEIPCIPAIVIARRLARGERIGPGARPCVGMMTFKEFDDAVRHLAVKWHIVDAETAPLQ